MTLGTITFYQYAHRVEDGELDLDTLSRTRDGAAENAELYGYVQPRIYRRRIAYSDWEAMPA